MTDLSAELLRLEEAFWKGNADFYQQRLADDSLMVFAQAGSLAKEQAVESIASAPRWSDVRMEDLKLLRLTTEVAALVYRAHALREGENEEYSALVSSVYVQRQGVWQLALHQQSPA
jgi:hypothetical protein